MVLWLRCRCCKWKRWCLLLWVMLLFCFVLLWLPLVYRVLLRLRLGLQQRPLCAGALLQGPGLLAHQLHLLLPSGANRLIESAVWTRA